ncbi:MAG TPA: TauD/TfdA family dioxygenase [Burkholderiales bacterium]|jgi:alpha-ketoglutarate-dependent 2,4-dichlorophenoxyacetate dioxygenase|nr:TauD/TfdA family dioxygenase [Burkholderiales bacterium]
MAITVKRLHPLFAAEIGGVDLTRALDDATFSTIENAFEEYSVLVFHGQRIDDEQQLAFSRRFGALEQTTANVTNDGKRSEVADISNVGADGKLMPLDSKSMKYRDGNEMWHSDSSFKPIPAKASLLSAREVPPQEGDTEFASLRAAYAALPKQMLAGLENLIAIHSYTYSRGLVDPDLFTPEQAAQVPPVRQSLIRINPKNGRKALYLGSHASHIEGMPVEAGRKILHELLAAATQPSFVYRHAWRQFDLVIWDNRAVLHRGRGWDKARHRRVMHRTTVAGEKSTLDEVMQTA